MVTSECCEEEGLSGVSKRRRSLLYGPVEVGGRDDQKLQVDGEDRVERIDNGQNDEM
jgi:hypothetical protein